MVIFDDLIDSVVSGSQDNRRLYRAMMTVWCVIDIKRSGGRRVDRTKTLPVLCAERYRSAYSIALDSQEDERIYLRCHTTRQIIVMLVAEEAWKEASSDRP